VVYATCDVNAFSHELSGYKFRKDFVIGRNDYGYTTSTKVQDVICTCNLKPVAKYILPNTINAQHVISYPNCARVLFTAFMRQLRDSGNKINPKTLNEYHLYCDKLFETAIRPLLRDFDYDVGAWMNHITTRNKQNEVLKFYNNYINGIKYHYTYEDAENFCYTMFAKKEKQIITEKKPKCRAISAAPPFVKWVMGPVVQKLEKIMHGRLDGYKMSNAGEPCKVWNEIEDMYENNYKQGFNSIIDIDGSAWDSTQHYGMKYLTNKIYTYLCDYGYIKHVDTEMFRRVALQKTRKLTAKCFIDKKTHVIFSANIEATTFSGSPDTTFMNTMTNLSLSHFVFNSYGLDRSKYKLSTSGDDFNCCIASEDNTPNLRNHIERTWKNLGLLPKYVLHGDYSNITFCSTNVIPYMLHNEQKFKVVRQIDRMLPLATVSEKALHYSAGRLKYHYQELINGLKTWAHNMPFYREFIQAYQKQHDAISEPYQFDPPGLPKTTFPSSEVYETFDYRNMSEVRVSDRQPPDAAVYAFLLEKYGLTQKNVEQIGNTLTQRVMYSPYEPAEASCTMDPYDMVA
jgi:hypothetical protein